MRLSPAALKSLVEVVLPPGVLPPIELRLGGGLLALRTANLGRSLTAASGLAFGFRV